MSDTTATTHSVSAFDGRSEVAQWSLELTQQADREICFFGPFIDPLLFDQAEVIQRISEIARRHPKTLIRFLVADGRQSMQHNPRLLSLAQTLSSKIKVHRCSKQDAKKTHLMLLADNSAFLYCPIAEQYTGRASLHAPRDVKLLKAEFEDMWAESTPDIDTRRLYI